MSNQDSTNKLSENEAAAALTGKRERSSFAVAARGVGKNYKLYDTLGDQALDMLGLSRFMAWRRITPRIFEALSDINIDVRHGERVGIIGRNGAGKTTLLKLLSGAASPTLGDLDVNGDIQALMSVGVGFHPEFTGHQNITASLLYSGLPEDEMKLAEDEILDFVELGDFIDQPLKTYSLGMKSRLQFACATAIRPDILIVDEVLGAGDAYFSAKSAARMEALTKSGCTLFLVSHSMGQVLQFCERAIWIEAGKVVADGNARQVVQEYEKFIHELRQQTKIAEVETLEPLRNSKWLRSRSIAAMEATTKNRPESDGSTDSTRWAIADSPIAIRDVGLHDSTNQETTMFRVGDAISFRISFEALRDGEYPCRLVFMIFSADGRIITRHCSDWYHFEMVQGEKREMELGYDSLMLGTGSYFYSCAVYEVLDLKNLATARWYDLYSRAFDFEVAHDLEDSVSMFHHPGTWKEVEGFG